MLNPKTNFIRMLADRYQKVKLTNTDYAQLAVFVTNHAFYEVLKKKVPDLKYSAVAGHSLGEYNAMVATGALRFEDALKLVQKRSQYMHSVSSKVDGGLVALVGKDDEELDALKQDLKNRGVYVALINAPQEIVVGGPNVELEKLIKEYGQRYTRKIKVEGPFHTSYMQPAAEQLKDDLSSIGFKLASIPIVANSSARFIVDPEEIEEELSSQVFNPIQWSKSIERMQKQGFMVYLIVGADKYNIIKNMVKKINQDAEVLTVKDAESLENIAIKIDKLL